MACKPKLMHPAFAFLQELAYLLCWVFLTDEALVIFFTFQNTAHD